jgi:hypothetical protein
MMNRRGDGGPWFLFLLLLSVSLSVLLALATNLAADLLPAWLARNGPVVWGAVGLLLATTAVVELWQRRSFRRPADRTRPQARPNSPPTTLKNLNIQAGLKNRAEQRIWYGPQSPPTQPHPASNEADQ